MYSPLAVFLFIPYNDINFNRSAEGSATGICPSGSWCSGPISASGLRPVQAPESLAGQ